ncbi:MAG: RES family NAD+ phosphorylase [Burkholderiaceae bacterium]|nr:RES family NAD+ phosphorylase [Burkholderiaceae bacterium]
MSSGLRAPGPNERFTVRAVTTAEVPVWYHVYSVAVHPATATTFSEGWGDTRFAPIQQADDTPVHTYYVASTREAVYMESVLHNVSLFPPGVFEVASLENFRLVELRLPSTIDFVSFHTKDLPRLRLSRAQLIADTPTDCYPQTRAWSQAAYDQRPRAQAIGYGSKRDDSARCLMLFRQRLPSPPLAVLEEHCVADAPFRNEVLTLVRSLEVREI